MVWAGTLDGLLSVSVLWDVLGQLARPLAALVFSRSLIFPESSRRFLTWWLGSKKVNAKFAGLCGLHLELGVNQDWEGGASPAGLCSQVRPSLSLVGGGVLA